MAQCSGSNAVGQKALVHCGAEEADAVRAQWAALGVAVTIVVD